MDVVERYTKEQGLFRRDGDPEPVFTEVLDLDLAAVVPSLAGPKRPQDRVALPDVWGSFVAAFRDHAEPDPKAAEIGRFMAEGGTTRQEALPGSDVMDVEVAPARDDAIGHGSVVIAAITSCTNTSNPSVMVAAGLLARKAVEAGLADAAVGEDVARSRFPSGDRLPRPGRASPRTSTSSASRSSATGARRASATRAR